MAKLPLNHIQNNEEGLSVRDKLNTVIDRINATQDIEGIVDDHKHDTSNPHKVKAPQVALEPIITPLAPNEQNVQDALEWLYGHFEQHANEGWHLDHIDGIYTVIQINRGPNTQFPPDPADLRVGELKLDWNEGKLWTKLGDDADVIIGGKGVIFEAPLDGELYGRKVSETDPTVGDWYRISLATVSDDMPTDPKTGDLWVDTAKTLELYVYIENNGWVSMTGAGAGGGALPDNITTDNIDGTMVNKLLGRVMYEDGTAIWRPIYTDDVITRGAQPMFRKPNGQFAKSTDPEAIRDQQTANWFLYELIQEMSAEGDWVPVSGGVFEGPIFGPSIPSICDTKHPVWSDFPNDPQDNILDDMTTDANALVVQTKMPGYELLGDDIQNRFKIRPLNQYQLSQWADGKDATLLFVENRGDNRLHMQVHEVEGGILYHRHPDGYGVLYGESKTCRGSVIGGGNPTYVYKVGEDISPYVTVELLRKIGESGELYVPAQGGEFTGPIFGPSVDNLNADNPSVLKVDSNPHADPTCPEGEVIVQTPWAYDRPVNGAEQRLKIHIADGADRYCGQPDIEYALVQANGRVQILVCEDSGFSSDGGTVLNVESQTCYGDDLAAGIPTQVWRTSIDASPYMTLEMFKKLALNLNVTAHAHVGPNPPLSYKDGALWFDTNPDVMTLFVWHEDAHEWEPCKPDEGYSGPGLDDLLWEEIDTGSNQNPPLTLMITHPTRPTQGGTEGLLHLWHGDPAQCTTNPQQEFKVWMRDGGASIVDKYQDDGIVPEFEIRQGDKSLRMKGISGGWTTNGQTYHVSCEEVTGDVLSSGPCELYIRYEDSPILELLDDRYVKKEGGDFMEGPLDIRRQNDGGASRDTNKVKTLGVYSGSDESALRLGVGDQTDRIYVGKNDTSFNGPIKVNEIVERNDDKGITVTDELNINDTIRFGRDHSLLMEINPESGTTQDILMFNGQPNGKNLKLDVRGATFNNAIQIESGPSSDREIVASIDSNKGIKFKNLSAWDSKIRDVADATTSKDAVNLRTAEGLVGELEQRIRDSLDNLIKENSAGEMKWAVVQYPQVAGTFTGYNASGSTETDPTQIKDLQVHNTNLSGYPFGWDQLKPGQYIYMTGPWELMVRFRVVGEPEDKGTWTNIPVADGFSSPKGYKYAQNDEFSVMFREFSGGTANLDDYLPIDGSKPMTGELEAYHKVMAKIPVAADPNDQEFETAVLMAEGWRSGTGNSGARITLSNKYNNNAYATIDYFGTTEASGNVQFARAKYEFKRFGNSRDGFTIRGRANNSGSVGNNAKLLSVYHNNGSGTNYDAVNYFGKMDYPDNIATVGYVSSLFGEESVVTPYGNLKPIANGRVPSAGEISFGSTKPSETASIALSKTDVDGNENDYHYGVDSIFSVVVESTIVSGGDEFPMKQLVSVRVDGVEDKGSYIVLTVDGRDVHCKQRDENTGQYFYAMDPRFWYFANEDTITPMQKVPASLDEMFQFRDETAVFPEYFKFNLSTASGDGIAGANIGYLYMEGSLTNPSWIRLSLYDRYGYGFLGKTDKSTATMTVNCPGEMTMFARSKWSKALVPVQGWKFDALYFNQNKESVRLNNKAETWKNAYHDWSDGEEVLVKFDFSRGTSTRMLEEQVADLTARLAKLEGGK